MELKLLVKHLVMNLLAEITNYPSLDIPYPLECNPGLLFSVMGFWVGFYSNLSYLGLYSSWGSIYYSLMGPEQTLQPLSLFVKVCDNISHFIGYVKNHFSLVNLKDQ